MMKSLASLALIALTLFAQPAFANTGEPEGGQWWSTLNQSAQREAVAMMYEGFLNGTFMTEENEAMRLHTTFRVIKDKIGYPEWSRSTNFYVAAITDFYTMHPRAAQTPIGIVFACLRDDAPEGACEEITTRYK